jgi:hypothetical protein
MSWTQYYARRDALDSVLVRAQRDPTGPLPHSDVFEGPAELLPALHYRWTLKLTGALGVALSEAEHDPSIDQVDAVSEAWRRTITDNPTLYAVLSAHAPRYEELRAMFEASNARWPSPRASPSRMSRPKRSPGWAGLSWRCCKRPRRNPRAAAARWSNSFGGSLRAPRKP